MTNSFLLEECFKTGNFLIVSNGISNSADHKFLKSLIKKYGYKNKICILNFVGLANGKLWRTVIFSNFKFW